VLRYFFLYTARVCIEAPYTVSNKIHITYYKKKKKKMFESPCTTKERYSVSFPSMNSPK
jgi:hypothetical protein